VPHPLQLLRLGSGPDILFPGRHPAELSRYLDKIAKTQLFDAQTLAQVQGLPIHHAVGDDGRPLVGIMLSEPSQLLPDHHHLLGLHLERVREIGARPVLLPPMADLVMAPAQRARTIRAQVAELDGLLGPGGDDVHPRIYDAIPTFSLSTNYPRDVYEADIARAAMHSLLFMFGVCRSHQLWNAASGGALFQDVRKNGRSKLSQNQLDYGLRPEQPFKLFSLSGKLVYENRVGLYAASEARMALSADSIVANSLHHQAVATPGAFRVSGVALDPDTGTETIEMTERWNGITMQFHPELMPSDKSQRALYDLFGRRAHVFRMRREQGAAVNPTALERSMRASGRFLDTDFRWLRANAARLA
jgi:gamma-glutamyl-gamma-aminobutyrate hydrolase PuuD